MKLFIFGQKSTAIEILEIALSMSKYEMIYLVDDQQEKILPILKDMKIKDDTLKNMGRYFKTSYSFI